MFFILLSLCDFSSFILISPNFVWFSWFIMIYWDFLWFVWTCLNLFVFFLIFCDLFGFFWICCDLFGICLDLSWFFVICCALFGFFCDLFQFFLIWVNTLCMVTYFCHTPNHWNVLKNGEKWCLYSVEHMMSLVCHYLSLLLLHKCYHMIFHIFEHFYQILYT